MNTTCQISNVSEDGLTVETWDFRLYDDTLYLDRYTVCTKKTKRHKMTTDKGYDRTDNRTFYSQIPLAEVPFSPEIRERAKAALMEKIVVKTWAERKAK